MCWKNNVSCIAHGGPENFQKIQAKKKLVKSNKTISFLREIAFWHVITFEIIILLDLNLHVKDLLSSQLSDDHVPSL